MKHLDRLVFNTIQFGIINFEVNYKFLKWPHSLDHMTFKFLI